MWTRCWRSQQLHGHSVGVVNDYGDKVGIVNNYTDTNKTTWTLLASVEGFLRILKEHSGEKRFLGVFKNPIAII